MIKSVGIIGLGAVGAVVGQQLRSFLGNDLKVIVDTDRKSKYKKNGIFINGEKQDFNFVTPTDLSPVTPLDLIIIATKNLQLKEALDAIKNGVGPNTVILSLLNGIQSEKDIAAAFGEEKTLYGFIIDLDSINLSGNITCTQNGNVVFGEKNNEITQRIKEITELFDKSKLKYTVPENIQLEMWKKFLINTVFNSLGAITRSTYGGFNFQVMQDCARKIGNEVIQIANAEGILLTNQMLENAIVKTCGYNPVGKCSMLQDVEAGRLTENNFFCGTIVKLGIKHNIPTPYCQFLGALLEGTEKVREIRK